MNLCLPANDGVHRAARNGRLKQERSDQTARGERSGATLGSASVGRLLRRIMFVPKFLHIIHRLYPLLAETTAGTQKSGDFDGTINRPANGDIVSAAVSPSLAGNTKDVC